MNDSTVIDIAVSAMMITAKLAAPILIVSLAIGVGVSLLQSVTQVQEFTLTSEFTIAKALVTRLEYRRDFSNAAFFPTDTGSAKKSQSTLTVGVLYVFGGKI